MLYIFVGNRQQDEIWINIGGSQPAQQGTFILKETVGGAEQTHSAELADLDRDGDLDALVVYSKHARIWLNDGAARFTAGQHLTFESHYALALGDIDSDGDIDIFAGSVNQEILTWFNDGSGVFSNKDPEGG